MKSFGTNLYLQKKKNHLMYFPLLNWSLRVKPNFSGKQYSADLLRLWGMLWDVLLADITGDMRLFMKTTVQVRDKAVVCFFYSPSADLSNLGNYPGVLEKCRGKQNWLTSAFLSTTGKILLAFSQHYPSLEDEAPTTEQRDFLLLFSLCFLLHQANFLGTTTPENEISHILKT